MTDQARVATIALLALAGEPMGRTRILEHLTHAGLALDEATLAAELAALREEGAVSELPQRGFVTTSESTWPAIRATLDSGLFPRLCEAYEQVTPLRKNWEGFVVLRSYRQGVALLRMALIGGAEPARVVSLLSACMSCHEAAYLHPLVDAVARPFVPEMFARIHPLLQDEVLTVLLSNVQREPANAPTLRAFAEDYLRRSATSVNLRLAMAEHLVLCGRLDDMLEILDGIDDAHAHMLRHVATLLRGDREAAIAGFDAALKALRRETGKRKAIFSGIGGHLYVLAMLQDPKHAKAADAYLDIATRAVQNHDTAVYQQLSMLRHIRGGTVDAAVLPTRAWETGLQPAMFRALLHYWLALPQLQDKRGTLEQLLAQSEQAGFDFITSQLASVLGRLGAAGAVTFEQRAIALRRAHRYTDLADWFQREEPWERQLNALINLQPPVAVEVVRETRLAWMIKYDPHYGIREIEPREQKRDAQGGWSKGRALSLKRLADDAPDLDWLTAQDLNVVATIRAFKFYGSPGARFDLELEKAISALIGHPLLFLMDSPGTRVELLPGEPELHVKARQGTVTISLRPPVLDDTEEVVVTRETPTRLRVVRITDEHRRIGAILGEGLEVPLHAEQQVLRAISAISSIVTVQSDIGGSGVDIEQVPADGRMHVHLLPYQQGLKMQILVRPLPGAGAFYPPGSGAESVIAGVNGIRTEAKRDLNAERDAERTLVGRCLVLEQAEFDHGEWLLGQPALCLELVEELQALDPQQTVIAWPEGESFRVTKKAGSKSVRIKIKRDKDWFAVDGELVIDEEKVMDLRSLIDAVQAGQSRFIELGNNQFLALTNELHRRLQEFASFGEVHQDTMRVHGLASFALEELAQEAQVTSDKAWKDHLKRMREATVYEPELPSTLQAELRDYQLEGFHWLARLAHWGVGACLADDMGLGKTLQALALLLLRAPQGPQLVVAPTSVCLNWMSETARFAPTLKVKLFGPGDRFKTIEEAEPFDLVIVSYGLLQLEASAFASRRWTSIVLDEAQAIKNTATKRSQAVMALQGDFRMVATGTPLENHLGELWNLFRFINPGLLGTLDQFQMRFAGPIERAQDKRAEAGARTRLRRIVAPFILRRTKAQVLQELPPRTEIVLPVELTQEETALYEALRRDALDRMAALQAPEQQKAIAILAEMMRLRRACCNPELVAPGSGIASSKLLVFARLLGELLENRHKVLVFSQFVDHLTLIRAYLDKQGIRYQYLDGATPMAERKRRVDAFQAGEGDVFLISLKAGGVGINLTAADYVIHMDPWWNPAVEDQASDRAHRMGQQRPVTIYRLVARGTIEDGIVELHQHKRDLADSLLEGSDVSVRMAPDDMLRMLQEGLTGQWSPEAKPLTGMEFWRLKNPRG
ncbi:DEAD/DEAH box helicase [Massilia arenosa]|uniref:DEAD/DEAH box helicase n=1 Tax=Zemynaea arenosa TaxID=2561931 RepID=A0A4Y9RNC4_9BURK|nr:DEAD/DEAH box helicase [Massilia arenosa]TFW10777.1 DEAD/DEAH box helicase [Massilia arenosa]